MTVSSKAIYGFFAILLVAMAGCKSSDDGGGGGGGGPLPTLTFIIWNTNGGNALTGAATNGGIGGSISISCSDNLLLDDGRVRPTVGTNFLTAGVMADSSVTYAELQSILASAPVGGITTFAIPAGTGFDLPAGVALNLADTPAGVTGVSFTTNSNIVLLGSIVTTRTVNDAVDLSFSTSTNNNTGIYVASAIDGRGSATRDGGDFGVSGPTTGGIFLTVNVNLSGGAGDAATDAGNGGNLLVSAGLDLIVPYGTGSTRGGAGTTAGGDAGDIVFSNFSGGGSFLANFYWNGDARGGDGGTGNGGNGGNFIFVVGTGTSVAFCRGITSGGASTSGDGGAAGAVILEMVNAAGSALAGDISGTLYGTADGGASTTGNGGFGSTVTIAAANTHDAVLVGEARGGAAGTGGSGGDGGAVIALIVDANILGVLGNAFGGDGGVDGGNGGDVEVQSLGTLVTGTWDQISVTGNTFGGVGNTGNGGAGGSIILGNPTLTGVASTVTITNSTITGNTAGGIGVNGGAGGTIEAGHQQGTMEISMSGNASGGDANGNAGATTNGGAGGTIGFRTNTATATLLVSSAFADGGHGALAGNGGNGGLFNYQGTAATLNVVTTGSGLAGNGAGAGNGGFGGRMVVDPTNNTIANNGTVTLAANMVLRGGTGDTGAGGRQGSLFLRCGTGGTFTASNITVDARGGNSNTGNGGGVNAVHCDASFGGNATISAGTLNFSAGSALGGNGNGGGVGDMSMRTTDFAMNFTMVLLGNSGNAAGSGNGATGAVSDIVFNLNSNGDATGGSLTLNGTVELNGGTAQAGIGGSGGQFTVNDSVATTGGNVTMNTVVHCNGGNSVSGNGGQSENFSINVTGNVILNGTVQQNTGNGLNGGAFFGGTCLVTTDANIDLNVVFSMNGGNGTNAGAVGGNIDIGANAAQVLNLAAATRIRSNGGTGTTGGNGGTINLDPAGVGPGNPNLTEAAGSVVEALGGAIGGAAGTVTRN